MAISVTGNNGSTAEGALTAAAVAKILVAPLQQQSQFLSSGVQIFDSPGGVPLRIPMAPQPTNPGFVGELETIPDVSPLFTEVDLLPSTMKSVKTLVKFSAELARQSFVSLDAALQNRLVTDVAATVDAALIAGNGDGITTPKGLVNYAGVQVVDKASAALSLDDILTGWGLATGAFVDPSRLRLMMRSETYTALRKIKSATGSNQYALGGGDATQAVGPNILGIPVTISNRLGLVGSSTKTTKVVLWDPSQVAVARDLAPSVQLLDQTFAAQDALALKVVTRYDAAPLNPQAIVRFDNVQVS